MPEFSSMPNLEELILNDCVSLIDIHPSVGNMKNLTTLSLRRCDKIKDLPDSIGDLESLEILNLSNSKFEKFSEKGRNMKSLMELDSNQLCNLQKLNISQSKMAGQIPVLPSSLKEIDAHHCTSKEDLSGLLWLCHLNWLKSTTEVM